MQVQLENDRTANVRFHYLTQMSRSRWVLGTPSNGIGKKVIVTECEITLWENSTPNVHHVFSGEAIRSAKDTFYKHVGRRLSLGRALHAGRDYLLSCNVIKIWDGYYKQHADYRRYDQEPTDEDQRDPRYVLKKKCDINAIVGLDAHRILPQERVREALKSEPVVKT